MEPYPGRDKLGRGLDTPEHAHIPDLKAILIQVLPPLLPTMWIRIRPAINILYTG